MHPNEQVLQQLFMSLNQHDHEAMAACYHLNAVFQDIAFHLRGKKSIHAMWHMICQPEGHPGNIRVMFEIIYADEGRGWVNLIDEYTFGSTGRKVINVIDSHFSFEAGLIVHQHDFCDPHVWGAMALGGTSGFLAGQFHALRSFKARQLLSKFIQTHPEYR